MFSFYDENFHPWSIKDAKDGDILTCKPRMGDKPWVGIFKCLTEGFDDKFDTHCFVTGGGHQFTNQSQLCTEHIGPDTIPASVEERETLFRIMHASGYDWDEVEKTLIRKT